MYYKIVTVKSVRMLLAGTIDNNLQNYQQLKQ
jgi:hypothetical protein